MPINCQFMQNWHFIGQSVVYCAQARNPASKFMVRILRPPAWMDTLRATDPESMAHILQCTAAQSNGKYLHWNDLRYRTPPAGLSPERWWLGIKMARLAMRRNMACKDSAGATFHYTEPPAVRSALSHIDRALGVASGPRLDSFANPEGRAYLVSALMEEAICSSQMEGASTSRMVARDMLINNRKPRNHSERMIFNNWRAMQHVSAIRDRTREITLEGILEVHRIIVEGTMDNPDDAGRLRNDDSVHVYDVTDGSLLHQPPAHAQLPQRLQQFCEFANAVPGREDFMHPLIHSMLLHFLLCYEHPFVDGNGRTARALFYWRMLLYGYDAVQYLPISRILHGAPAQYRDAYLHTETDDGDCTYFIIHQLGVLERAIADAEKYQQKKRRELDEVQRLMPGLMRTLNHRQTALLGHALRVHDGRYTAASHGQLHGVARETARTDLMELEGLGLLSRRKAGRAWAFASVPRRQLMKKLRVIGDGRKPGVAEAE